MITRHFQMGTKTLAIGIVALAAASGMALRAESGASELSFTVQTLKETNVEGPDVERTFFMAAGRRMVFGLPKGFRLTNDAAGFVLLPAVPDFDGEIHVTRSVFTPESDLARDALKYRDAATQDMPKGATEIEVQPPAMDPFPYNGWKSLGFTWSYSLYGRRMIRTVSYINLEIGVQVLVTTLANEKDAPKAAEAARQFMGSWWVKP